VWEKLIKTDADGSALVLRVVLGVVMFAHGAQKMLGWFGGSGFGSTLEEFTSQGIPYALGVVVVLAEFFGSIGLILGVLSRVAALGIGIIMVVAIFAVHWQHGFFMNWFGTQEGEGFEYHLLVLAICIVLLVKGSGAFSIDHAMAGER
jgi:putative oxidoreductase